MTACRVQKATKTASSQFSEKAQGAYTPPMHKLRRIYNQQPWESKASIMIRALAYTLQALVVVTLSCKVFLVLRNLDSFYLTSNGVSGADIATALQTEYTGLHQLLHETQSLPAISRNLTIGSFGVEDLANIVRHSSLDCATVLAGSLEAFRADARTTAQHLRTLQLKVDGLAGRYDYNHLLRNC